MFGSREILSLVSEIGLIPTILLVGVALFFIHKEIKKTLSSLDGGLGRLREDTSASLSAIRSKMEERESLQEARMDGLERTMNSGLQQLREDSERSRKELRKDLEDRDHRQDSRIESIEKELKFISREYVTREQHYNDTEGWKSHLDSLSQDLADMPLKMIALIKEVKT